MANMHVIYHTSRAYSPPLSESCLAGRPRAAFSQSDRHFVWLAMANMHVMYHTSRAYSPPLSESWLAGRAALFSKWSTFRVISDGERAHYVSYITCMFAIAKWKLACWAAACTALCSSTSWIEAVRARLSCWNLGLFESKKTQISARQAATYNAVARCTSCNNLSSLQFEWPYFWRSEMTTHLPSDRFESSWINNFNRGKKTTNPSKRRT